MPRSLRVAPQYIEQVKSALQRNRFARQQDLAEELNISRDTVNKFFTGKPVGYLNFLEICDRLGLNLEEIADFETEDSDSSQNLKYSSLCNLPHRDYPEFIGRKKELGELLKYISPGYRQHITIVEGIGGVGKTALVLEAAYLCWEAKQGKSSLDVPIFDAIIFTSAKDSRLLPIGILRKPIGTVEATLHDIFWTISRTLNDPTIVQASEKEQIQLVYQSLGKQSTLLIVDNMETIKGKDREEILSFLWDLPATVQAVITTRERIVLYAPIRLEYLSEKESLQLIKQQADEKKVTLTEEQSEKLYHRYGGIPLALIYAVGQRASGYSLKRILDLLAPLPKDIANFCFEGSVKPLRGKKQAAHKLLMSLAFFSKAPVWDAVAAVAGLRENPMEVEDGLAQLQKLSLVREQEDRYKMLPITREYVLAELAKYPDFDQEARERWIKWYLDLVKKYGGKDWEDWRVNYDSLEDELSNITQVLSWCAAHNRYTNVKDVWQMIDPYIDIFGNWQTRINWWTWLIEASQQRGDLSTYVMALSVKGRTLTLLGGKENQKEADELFTTAWNLRDETDFSVQADLAINIAGLRMTQKKYEQGLQWLDRAEDLVDRNGWEEPDRIRDRIAIAYYRAEIYYKQESYDLAKPLFQTVVEQGKQIGWQRFANYAQNYLADIELEQGNLSEAEKLLKTGLFIAENYKEKRRIALYQASYASLEKARRKLEKAREWGNKALEGFKSEGIKEEAEKIRLLLASLDEDNK